MRWINCNNYRHKVNNRIIYCNQKLKCWSKSYKMKLNKVKINKRCK